MTARADRDLLTNVIGFSKTLGREIRQDPPPQLGVPTQDLAVLALSRGDRADAIALSHYMVEEFRIVFDTVLNGWLHQLLEHAILRLGAEKIELALRVPRKHAWDAFFLVGKTFAAEAVACIEAGENSSAVRSLDHVRRVFKTVNDETVRFIQDIMTSLADAYGEDEPIRAQRKPYESIWRTRYAEWPQLTPEEQLQLSCEGMRAHYGGPTRHGEFTVVDDGDRYRMVFAACGTGGMLRYGDPETGEGPWPTTGLNRTPKPYTWQKTGVPWYCTHCSLYLEHWAAEDHGYPLRPVVYNDDPSDPVSTSWLIYKDSTRTRAEDYERVGLKAPDGAPR